MLNIRIKISKWSLWQILIFFDVHINYISFVIKWQNKSINKLFHYFWFFMCILFSLTCKTLEENCVNVILCNVCLLAAHFFLLVVAVFSMTSLLEHTHRVENYNIRHSDNFVVWSRSCTFFSFSFQSTHFNNHFF